jgi:DhnA family fructose-bisphosphate aldolase class Ia
MTGEIIRLKRFLPDGENSVVVAVDHGEFFGPLEGVNNVPAIIKLLKEADGILLAPGMVKHCADHFCDKQGPTLIVRLNWSASYAFQWEYNDGITVPVITPQEALTIGVDIGLASCLFKTKDENTDALNAEQFAKLLTAKRHVGLPLVGEYYPVHANKLTKEQLHNQVAVACRVMAEMGADAVKTFYTGKRFSEITKDLPIPVLVLGADKMEKEADALQLAYDAVNDGARGVFFGRNVTQAKNPTMFLKALKACVKEGVEPLKAAKAAGL